MKYNVIIADDRRIACNLKHYITNCLSLIFFLMMLLLEVMHANLTHRIWWALAELSYLADIIIMRKREMKIFWMESRINRISLKLMSAIIKWAGGGSKVIILFQINLEINFLSLVPLMIECCKSLIGI